MDQLIIAVASVFSALGGGWAGSLFTKRKYNQEVEKLKIENLNSKESAETIAIDNDIKLSGHYKIILDDLKSRYETRFKEFEDLMNRKNSLLEEEIKIKDRKIKLQQQEIVELKKENRQLKAANKVLNDSHNKS